MNEREAVEVSWGSGNGLVGEMHLLREVVRYDGHHLANPTYVQTYIHVVGRHRVTTRSWKASRSVCVCDIYKFPGGGCVA